MRLLHSATLLLVAGVVGAAAVVRAAENPIDEIVKDRVAFIPTGSLQPLPGRTIGILVSNPQRILALEGQSTPSNGFRFRRGGVNYDVKGPVQFTVSPNAIAFSRGGANYRWVFMHVDDKPPLANLEVLVGEGFRTKRYDGVDLATPATVKRFGITEPYALVEVEVNSGLGSPVDDKFVATNLRQLDGTKDYPAHVSEVIAGLRKRYETELDAQYQTLEAALVSAQQKALKDQIPTGPRQGDEVMYVTWEPRSELLQVRFRTTITDGAYQYDNVARFGTQFGVEWGRGYDVSKTGTVQRTLTLPAQSFTRVLPLP